MSEFESHFEFGLEDLVQPCGVTHKIMDQYQVNYKERHDIGILIEILKSHPVYGISGISDEIIQLIEKTRIKPFSRKVHKTEELHSQIRKEFSRINPKRGFVDRAYSEITEKLGTSIENVKTVISRARKDGWEGDLNPFTSERLHIIKRVKI